MSAREALNSSSQVSLGVLEDVVLLHPKGKSSVIQ